MAGKFRAREIRESPGFVEAKNKIQPDTKRLDDQLCGVTWALSRHPERFARIEGRNLYRVLTEHFPDAPRLRIWYTFDENRVDLLYIELAEELNEG